jgi:AcrR family transcriptional regulator
MTWQRARSEEQKAQRIRELANAAGRLHETTPLAEITIAMIAREAGWTRSNVYKYFATKEEVFLEVLKEDLRAWRRDVVELCHRGDWSVGTFIDPWLSLYDKHERMVELMSILTTVLEKNCSIEKLTAFKATLLGETQEVAACLVEALPFRDIQDVSDFLQASVALLIGLAPIWRPTEKQRAAIAASGHPMDPAHLRSLLARATESILDSLTR